MEIVHSTFSEPAAPALMAEIAPGASLESIRPVSGDFSNREFYLDACSSNGEPLRFVVKLYQGERDYCLRRARMEHKTLQWLHLHHRPAPEPVFLDESGCILGGPGIVTRFLPGRPVLSPPYPPDWGRQMALTLASIHAYPVGPAEQDFLLDANREAVWFRGSGQMPAWLAADPDGALIWRLIDRLLPRLEMTTPKLIHLDYWAGNVLYHEGQITAVVDWEEASYGDPGVDVGYCLMDMVLSGLDNDAAEFLSTYEAETSGPVANLALWKLAAAARPIRIPKGYIDYSPVQERFRKFVQDTVRVL